MHFVRIGNHVINLHAVAVIRVSEASEGGKWTSALVSFITGVAPDAGTPLTIEFTGDDAVRLQAILSRLG